MSIILPAVPPISTGLIFLLALCIGTVTDVRTRDIPIPLFPCASLLSFAVLFLHHVDLKDCIPGDAIWGLLAMGAISAVSIAITIVSKRMILGGGDCIAFVCIGFSFGLRYGVWVVMISCLFACVFQLFASCIKKNDHSFPMIPFLLAGHVTLWLALHILAAIGV